MTARTRLLLLGIGVLIAGAALLWFFFLGDLVIGNSAEKYQETNASWKVQGVCTNAHTGAPIKDAQVTASFQEAISFKHHWRNPPALTRTNVVVKTDAQGRFEVIGEGGSAYVKAQAVGYREPEPWENWSCSARNGISHVDTNIALSLEPILKAARVGNDSTQ